MSDFSTILQEGYTFRGASIPLGVASYNSEFFPETLVSLPLATMNRHGLVSGATGTGKTKTIQKILEGLSEKGIPALMMDMKGDISGIALPGTGNSQIEERLASAGNPVWKPQGFPVEFFSLLGTDGIQLRATVSEFGPVLFSRMFELSESQSGAISLVFRYCDDKGLLLVDLDDLRTVISYLANEGKEEILKQYGGIAPATLQVLMRKIMEIESQGGSVFFSEPSLDISDLLRRDDSGKGQINIVRLGEVFAYPKLFMTFMVSILTELFHKLPEVGDIPEPKFIIFIDEAHLLFRDASPSFLSEMEMIIKLIRSKGVGVFFCTQNPTDIPESILSQLGIKIQHALRAFTAKDHDSLKKAAKNFPVTPYYQVENDITTLGTGEAFVTVLSEKGLPTPLIRTLILPPESRMDVLTDTELQSFLAVSPLFSKYKNPINEESAHEILSRRIEQYDQQKQQIVAEKERRKNPTIMETVTKTATKSIATEMARTIGTKIGGRKIGTVGAQIVRGIFGSIFR